MSRRTTPSATSHDRNKALTGIEVIAARLGARKIAFTCDFTRFHFEEYSVKNTQYRNLDWMVECLGGVSALEVAGLTVSVVRPSADSAKFARQFDSRRWMSAYESDPIAAWARNYDEDKLPFFQTLIEELAKNDLVVAFELSPTLKRILHKAGTRYIDLSIHPIRFLHDLCFGATTNDTAVDSELRRMEMSPAHLHWQIQEFKARFAHKPHLRTGVPEGVPLIIGQTTADAMLIAKRRIASWADFLPSVLGIIRNSPAVAFLPHPNSEGARNRETIESLRCVARRPVLASKVDSYRVLFSSPAAKVLTLSSSLGVEARELGLDVQFLLGSPLVRRSVEGADTGMPKMLGHALLSANSNPAAVNKQFDPFPLGRDHLRSGLEGWGFHGLLTNETPTKPHFLCIPASREDKQAIDRLFPHTESWEFADDPPLSMGQSMRWTSDSPWLRNRLGGGWHGQESWGVWAAAPYSTLFVPVVDEGILRICARLRIFDGIRSRAPLVIASVNDDIAAILSFRACSDPEHTIEIFARVVPGLVRLELFCEEGKSPASAGLNRDDGRELRFSLIELEAELGPDDDAVDISPAIWGVTERRVRVRNEANC